MANEIFRSLDIQIQNSQREIEYFTKNNYLYLENIKLQYLKSLVLLIVSEYEIIIERLFYLRASECKDVTIANFVKVQMNQIFRSPDMSKITKILKMFDEKLFDTFHNKIKNKSVFTVWDNLVKTRHNIVHRLGTLNMTYEELIASYPKTKEVIFALVFTLGLDVKKYTSV